MNNQGYRYFICDVFTQDRFGGNPLAVLPEAGGLDAGTMQRIAREFNFSETTFVFPGSGDRSRQVRIFTPASEIPFAGHPNIGTAFALARDGAFGDIGDGIHVRFDEQAGAVGITVRAGAGGGIWCELQAPQPLTLGDSAAPDAVADALSLAVGDIVTTTHPPQMASVGLPFLMVEVAGLDALRRARVDHAALDKLQEAGVVPDLHVYTRSDDEFDLRARMFAPFQGVPEDPATGSVNCALTAMLTTHAGGDTGELAWRIAQGVEMGRPSVLDARTRNAAGEVTSWIGGYCVLVSEGRIFVE